jgi:hypothetical protein
MGSCLLEIDADESDLYPAEPPDRSDRLLGFWL